MLFSYYDRYQYAVNPLVEVICQLRFPAILSISAKDSLKVLSFKEFSLLSQG